MRSKHPSKRKPLPSSPQPSTPSTRLAKYLLSSNHCATSQESSSVAESIIEDVGVPFDIGDINTDAGDYNKDKDVNDFKDDKDVKEACACLLCDYFDVTVVEGRVIAGLVFPDDNEDEGDNSDSDSDNDNGSNSDDNVDDEGNENNEDNEDEEAYISSGECTLCERFIRLTRHHLIPISTHPRMKVKLLHAMDAFEKGDLGRGEGILGVGLRHLIPGLFRGSGGSGDDEDKEKEKEKAITSRSIVRTTLLMSTIQICRPCHTTIHKTHDNMKLAEEFNTLEKLMEDENIRKFAKWASRQKQGKFAM